MHYLTGVVLPEDTTRENADELVAEALAPFSEEISEEGWWDWWQVGGRWTGLFAEYDPTTDPANIETCWLCAGTGVRTDGLSGDGCNGCQGKGQSVKWPTQFAPMSEDVFPIATLLRNPGLLSASAPYRLVAGGRFYERQTYRPDEEPHFLAMADEDWHELVLSVLADHSEGRLVVVDCHS